MAAVTEHPVCPKCRLPLRPIMHAGVALSFCVECRGLWFEGPEVERVIGRETAEPFRANLAGPASRSTPMGCPRGEGAMREVMLEIDGYRAHTTGCTRCGGVWMDRGELVRIRPHLPKPAVASDERIEGLELRVAEAQREADEARAAQAEEQAPWRKRIWVAQLLPVLLAQSVVALPLEVYSPVRARPWATYALILANVLVFLGQWFSPYVPVEEFGLVPAVFLAREAPWTIITSMFLHGNLLHLLGNVYFLRVFGDNVEDRLGIPEYLALYFLGGVVAGLAHIASNPASAEPLIGASGAVSAVMGAYVYLFPHRRLYMMLLVFLRRIRAVWYLAVWLVLQLVYAALGFPGVAWWAHIGGFALGIAAAALHRSVLRRRLARSEAMPAAL